MSGCQKTVLNKWWKRRLQLAKAWGFKQVHRMSRNKCGRCGVVNLANDTLCRRCGSSLNGENSAEAGLVEGSVKRRSFWRSLIWIAGTTALILFIGYVSLLLTSADLSYDQTQTINKALALLVQKGFDKQVFVLNRLARYRSTDNWWNRYLGHHDAYAATNFPFEIVTLYPEFFQDAVDDNERAVILLHESFHLLGSGEEGALEGVWRNKQRLGWTSDKYGKTKVWVNTRELTMAQVPDLFVCGADGKSDCIQ